MSNIFPPINSVRPEPDVGAESNGSYSPSASKFQRQISFTNNDRSPLGSKTIATSKQFTVAATHGTSAELKHATNGGNRNSTALQKRSSFAQNNPQLETNKSEQFSIDLI
ncbi:unnamed protein product [Didymodactylos carnosus]|uniref:Uncharacterized protein n=1 Tax=Didymodactylos carnosus TaxID=1234261 RepID=A0A8S2FDP0_9BILA|nr:unnamed protein product [Didymodactylos carnosus]CAF4231822.1 unnamed protein product [Didymodactylos carnosus]